MSEVAETILSQLKVGEVRGCQSGLHAMCCWGARKLVSTQEGLLFKVNGRNHRGLVHIKYDIGQDLYDIEFLNLRARKTHSIEGVFCESLANSIDSFIEANKGN